jgi:hypothetical protein
MRVNPASPPIGHGPSAFEAVTPGSPGQLSPELGEDAFATNGYVASGRGPHDLPQAFPSGLGPRASLNIRHNEVDYNNAVVLLLRWPFGTFGQTGLARGEPWRRRQSQRRPLTLDADDRQSGRRVLRGSAQPALHGSPVGNGSAFMARCRVFGRRPRAGHGQPLPRRGANRNLIADRCGPSGASRLPS